MSEVCRFLASPAFKTRRIDIVLRIRKTDLRNEVTLLWLSVLAMEQVSNRMPLESGIASQAKALGNAKDMLTEAL